MWLLLPVVMVPAQALVLYTCNLEALVTNPNMVVAAFLDLMLVVACFRNRALPRALWLLTAATLPLCLLAMATASILDTDHSEQTLLVCVCLAVLGSWRAEDLVWACCSAFPCSSGWPISP